MTEWLLLGAGVLLIGLCGLFVAGEFSLLAADRATIERAASAGDRRAAGVAVAFRSLSTQLSGVQIAITLTNLAVGFLAEPALSGWLRGPLRAVGVSGAAGEAAAAALALVISTVLTMVFGELVPKNLAIAAPVSVARAVQAPVRAFTTLMRGPIRLLDGLATAVLALFGLRPQEELASARSPDELVSLVRRSADEGTLAPRTATLVVRSLAFGAKRAAEVMTPRPRMVTVPAAASVGDFLRAAAASGRSRLPVTGPDGLDDIVGVLDLDRAVGVPAPRRDRTPVTAVMIRPVEVPESLPLVEAVRTLQAGGCQLAVVVDEWGGTAGLLTGEDLLEELVGEVDDEHDVPVPALRRAAVGWDASGLLRPDEVRAATGLRLPEGGPYDTVGGLVMQRLGRIPAIGDRVVVDGVAVTVTRMERRRVDRVQLALAGAAPAARPRAGAR